ncbi:hypothetical protein ACER0A_010315 [Haloimpatiens sp. FM7315]|uniref:hypothetical protein n=1 Tax=Haloimpatiens sp. FM7315 TaxID=3298609 RepID=UPI0035A30324
MRKLKKIYANLIILFILIVLVSFPIEVRAEKIDAVINDNYIVFNIKFNQEILIDEESLKDIVIKNANEIIKPEVKLKDKKTISILPPKNGYKEDVIYTINLGKKVHSKNYWYLKEDFKYVFKVNKSKDSSEEKYKYKEIVDKTIEESTKKMLQNKEIGDWEALAIHKSNKALKEEYGLKLKKDLEGRKDFQPTDYERIVLGVLSFEKDPLNFYSLNLIENIYNNKDIEYQGINGYIFALIAIDSKKYPVPEGALWTREKLVERVLKCRTKEGGWDFAGIKADPDMTAMAITSLVPYKDDLKVSKAILKAIDILSCMQNSDATFSCYGMKNSESISQVIIGLCSNNVDPTSSKFTKNGINLIDALLKFKTSNGGFSHLNKGRQDSKATEQAILALEAYRNFKLKKGLIYEFR